MRAYVKEREVEVREAQGAKGRVDGSVELERRGGIDRDVSSAPERERSLVLRPVMSRAQMIIVRSTCQRGKGSYGNDCRDSWIPPVEPRISCIKCIFKFPHIKLSRKHRGHQADKWQESCRSSHASTACSQWCQ